MISTEEHSRLRELEAIVHLARKRNVSRLSLEQLEALPRLYRFASSLHARLETSGSDPRALENLRVTLLRAHGLVYREAEPWRAEPWKRTLAFFLMDVPRTVRAEWRLLAGTFLLIYGLAAVAYVLVRGDLSLAYTLFFPEAVDKEIAQLRAIEEGGEFRGNFNFGVRESPGTAGALIGNNLRVAAMFFAMGLVPPLYVFMLAVNSLMLGTYTAVAGHWEQAGSISSILWCHGVLEIQAIVLAGTAGLVLLRAWIAPGPWTRAHALRLESRRAFHMLAPVLPMLIAAGFIEAFVSPHAPFGVRIAVAVTTGLGLVGWLGFSGRRADPVEPVVS